MRMRYGVVVATNVQFSVPVTYVYIIGRAGASPRYTVNRTHIYNGRVPLLLLNVPCSLLYVLLS